MTNDPLGTTLRLDRVDMGILTLMMHLINFQIVATGTSAKYCFPGQSWLAKQLGVTRETINHHVQKLRHLGILGVTHRRKKAGHWQTCLYVIRQYTNWGWARARELLITLSRRVKKASHIVPPQKELNRKIPLPDLLSPEERGRIVQMLRDLRADMDNRTPPYAMKPQT